MTIADSPDFDGNQIEYKPMSRKERVVCSTLCMCLAVSVISGVAIIYLTVIIYVPARNEMASGINEVSVMCTTTESRRVHGNPWECRTSSCSEWCLSKGGGDCTNLYVKVRANGTDVEFQSCSDVVEKQCQSLDMGAVERRNCKEDHQCTRLNNMFRCEDGLCFNISNVYTCFYSREDADPPISCARKRNCVELEGMFDCEEGMCRKVPQWFS